VLLAVLVVEVVLLAGTPAVPLLMLILLLAITARGLVRRRGVGGGVIRPEETTALDPAMVFSLNWF
jgi:hypothetical protein